MNPEAQTNSIDAKLTLVLLIVHSVLVTLPVLGLLFVLIYTLSGTQRIQDPDLWSSNITSSLVLLALYVIPTVTAWILYAVLRYRVKRIWWVAGATMAFSLIVFCSSLVSALMN